MYEITEVNFNDVHPYWDIQLWPNRSSPIKDMSSMQYNGGYDMDVYQLYRPTFWGVFDGSKLIGVNSGHRSAVNEYRSRGIWVNPAHRKQGIAAMLFDALTKQAILEKCDFIWSLPRKGSEHAYIKFGFITTSDWFNKGMEFGPNCRVKLTLAS